MEIRRHHDLTAAADPLPGAQLVLMFAPRDAMVETFAPLKAAYPQALVVGCSGAGQIRDTEVDDDGAAVVAIRFAATTPRLAVERVERMEESGEAGRRLGRQLVEAGGGNERLAHVLILSDGLKVNGSELTAGVMGELPEGVAATGGLSGDGDRFEQTLVCADRPPEEGVVLAVGLYGERLRVGYGSIGGWDPFGPDRVVTRSRGNVLYELDGQSALALYKRYLADQAERLPASGLLFPLALRHSDAPPEAGVVRTVLAIDEAEQSMTFAGDLPEGRAARLMKANFDRLIDGAAEAAKAADHRLSGGAELALLISCIGRKLVLQQRVEEELDGVGAALGGTTPLIGFYSYGEIAPNISSGHCELHNQTMTVTTLVEQ